MRLGRAAAVLTCTVDRNTAITCPWLLARDRSTSRDRILVVPSHMDSTCGEEHQGAFAVTAAEKGSGREQTQGRHRGTKDISRDLLSHNKWKGAVEPSSMAVPGTASAPGTHPVLPWG